MKEIIEQLGYQGGRVMAMALDRGLLELVGGPEWKMTAAEHEARYGHQFPKTLDEFREQQWRKEISS